MRGILTRFSLQKSQFAWRAIEFFAGCGWLIIIHRTAARIVRYFLYSGIILAVLSQKRHRIELPRAYQFFYKPIDGEGRFAVLYL